MSSNDKKFKYLLPAIDYFTEFTWFKPLKDKKGKAVLSAFIEIVSEVFMKNNFVEYIVN